MQFVCGSAEIFLPPFNEFSRQLPKYAKVKGPRIGDCHGSHSFAGMGSSQADNEEFRPSPNPNIRVTIGAPLDPLCLSYRVLSDNDRP